MSNKYTLWVGPADDPNDLSIQDTYPTFEAATHAANEFGAYTQTIVQSPEGHDMSDVPCIDP